MSEGELLPIGTRVSFVSHSIGGRSEIVTGEVVYHKYRKHAVKTEYHGICMVPRGKAQEVRA